MVAPRFTCDRDTLARAVRGHASQAELAVLEDHLADCGSCRTALSTISGGDALALEARRLLSTDSSSEPAVRSFDLSILDACDDPRFIGALDHYLVESVIGHGGFGVVFKAWDPRLGRHVAVKALASPLLHSAPARQRFAREAQAAAAIAHEAVVRIHAVETEGRVPYLVLGYVPGTSLEARLREEGPLDPIRVVRIAAQVAAGLAAAHAQGIVHRDIKPGNVLLDGDLDRVQITDFGLARVVDDASQTHSGLILGTPQYMSPEQARGDLVDQQSDLFSLGSVMYAMCCGHSPFRAETTLGVLRRICDHEPPDVRHHAPDVPAPVAGIIHALLAKDPAARLDSAAHAADLLRACLARMQRPLDVAGPAERDLRKELDSLANARSRPGRGSLAAVIERVRSAVLRRWHPGAWWSAGALAAMVLVVGLVAALGSRRPPPTPPSLATVGQPAAATRPAPPVVATRSERSEAPKPDTWDADLAAIRDLLATAESMSATGATHEPRRPSTLDKLIDDLRRDLDHAERPQSALANQFSAPSPLPPHGGTRP